MIIIIIIKIASSLFNRCDLYARLDDLKANILLSQSFLVKAYPCCMLRMFQVCIQYPKLIYKCLTNNLYNTKRIWEKATIYIKPHNTFFFIYLLVIFPHIVTILITTMNNLNQKFELCFRLNRLFPPFSPIRTFSI